MAEAVNRSGILAQYPNVDGVVSFVHGTGCGLAGKGEGYEALERTQWGYAGHPNLAAALVVGLGCEVFQIERLKSKYGLIEGDNFRTMTIQDTGGTKKTIEAGVARIKEMLPRANRRARETIPASELCLALQCGGSDGYSGITANPALGAAVDLLVRHGGTAVLSETPEIYGAEHLLTRRARTREVGEKLVDIIHWWQDYCAKNDGSMDNNPSPRQQGRRPHHHPREVAGRRGQGRHHHADRGLPLRRAGHRQGLRLHGHAGLRSRRRHRPGRRRLQRAVLHDGPRLGLRLQAHALDQARHQPRHLPPHARRHGHQLRRHPRRRLDRGRRARRSSTPSCASPPARRPRASCSATATTSSSPGRSARRCSRGGGVRPSEFDTKAPNVVSWYLKDLRARARVSQAVLASYLGVTVGYLSRLERGEVSPSRPVARLLDIIRRKGLEAIL